MATTAAVVGAGSAVYGAYSSSKNKPKAAPTQESGLAALPPAVQDAWVKTYLPQVLGNYEKGFQARPMQRVGAPKNIFDSQELYKLQQYSDAMGGMFTPRMKNVSPLKKEVPVTPMTQVDREVMAKYGMTLSDYITQKRPDVVKALGGGNRKFTQIYGQGDASSDAALGWWRDWGSKGM